MKDIYNRQSHCKKKEKKSYTEVVMYDNTLKVQLCKLYNSKYMIASVQITNNKILPFIAVL